MGWLWLLGRFQFYNVSRSILPESQKLKVWAGVFGDSFVGHFFPSWNLTGDMYLELFENAIYPALTILSERTTLYIPEEHWRGNWYSNRMEHLYITHELFLSIWCAIKMCNPVTLPATLFKSSGFLLLGTYIKQTL